MGVVFDLMTGRLRYAIFGGGLGKERGGRSLMSFRGSAVSRYPWPTGFRWNYLGVGRCNLNSCRWRDRGV